MSDKDLRKYISEVLLKYLLPIDLVRQTVGPFHQYEIGTGYKHSELAPAYEAIKAVHVDTLICVVDNAGHPQKGKFYLFIDSCALAPGPLDMKEHNAVVRAARFKADLNKHDEAFGDDHDAYLTALSEFMFSRPWHVSAARRDATDPTRCLLTLSCPSADNKDKENDEHLVPGSEEARP